MLCQASDRWRAPSPAECGFASENCYVPDEDPNSKLKSNHNYHFTIQGEMAKLTKNGVITLSGH